jgi:hypothetical protein
LQEHTACQALVADVVGPVKGDSPELGQRVVLS